MIDLSGLGHFTGSLEWTRHWASPDIIYSEGMAYVAEQAGAHWLLDAIASHLTHNHDLIAKRKDDPDFDFMHFWYLTVNDDQSAVLECKADSDQPAVVTQEIEYTDFPLGEFTVYVGNDGPGTPSKLFLPSEY
jgi:hypothetical protein